MTDFQTLGGSVTDLQAAGLVVTPVMSTAVEGSHILAAGPAQLWSLMVLDTVSEYVLVMNAATLPADGAVKLLCPPIAVVSGVTTLIVFPFPIPASIGIVVCTSSTGTFTKTLAGATAIFLGQVTK